MSAMRRALAALALVPVFLVPTAASAAVTDPTPSIVGGSYVSSAPWAAALYNNGRVYCSGTIIASRWVLTARHCVDQGGSFSVRVGNVRHAAGVRANVSSVSISPEADLALLRLDRSISTTYARLATSYPPLGSTNNIYGWGTLTNTDPTAPLSDWLKTARVRVTSHWDHDNFGGWAIRSERIDGSTGWGDSGGPQMYNGTQVGVLSTGTLTEQSYANVIEYRPWIRSVSGV
jgi:secreted trypsin-like serine protease